MKPNRTVGCGLRIAVATALLVAVCLGLSSPGRAMMVPQTVNQLAANSTHIARGRVLDMRSQWDPTHAYIYTTVTLQVSEWQKGAAAAPGPITVYVPGGEVGEVGLRVEHAPSFAVGEDVIVFLEQAGDIYGVTSWEQGKYTIVNGSVVEKKIPVATFVNQINKAVQR